MLINVTAIFPLLLPVVGLAFGFLRRGESAAEKHTPSTGFQALTDSAFDGVLALEPNGRVTWTDEHFDELMHLMSHEVVGSAFASLIDPADHEKLSEYLERALRGAQSFELHALDGRGMPRMLRMTAVASSREQAEGLLLGVRDISEEESLRRRIAFTEKMDVLTRLMTAIGNDLRHALRTLSDLVEHHGDEPARQTLDRLREMERRITLFPVRGINNGSDVLLPELIRQAEQEARASISGMRDIPLVMQVGQDIPAVFAEPQMLGEALRQVLLNALQAVSHSGAGVEVTVAFMPVARALPRRGFILPAGDWVHIRVADTGPGIPPEMLDHIFDPLFTTRGGNPLAGLGMAAAYTIIKNHRGFIELNSEVGRGSRVDMFLPRSRVRDQALSAIPEAVPEPAAETGSPPAAEPMLEPDATKVPAEIPADLEPAESENEPSVRADKPDAPEIEPAIAESEPESAEIEPETPPAKPAISEAGPVAPLIEETIAEAERESEPEPLPVQADVSAQDTEPDEEITEELMASLSGHETILVIEEESSVRLEIADMLGQFGYNVLPARNWVEGVDLFKRHARLVDLVLLNVLVPEMIWVKTLMDLRRVSPQAQIGLMGESVRSDAMERYLSMEGISYLTKPLAEVALARGIRTALDEGSAEPADLAEPSDRAESTST